MIKLFVGGLPYSVNSEKLNEIFTAYGQVSSAIVITDKYTNQSKGFGFVEMSDNEAAQKAIKALDGSDLEGRRLGVSIAKPREEHRDNFNRDNFRGGGNSFPRNNRRR